MARVAAYVSLFLLGIRPLFASRNRWLISLQLAILVGLAQTGSAQVDPLAGIQPFSTQSLGVDLASSQVTQRIPIRNKNGLVPFNYSVISGWHFFKYDDSGTWYWGLGGSGGNGLGLMGSGLGLTETLCSSDYWTFSNLSLRDSTGTLHMFPTTFTINGCSTASLAAVTTTDGSGYTLVVSNQQAGPWWVYDKGGNYGNFFGALAPATVYTPDGVAYASAGATYTDSLNTTVLTVKVGNYHDDTSDSWSYTDASGTTQTYQATMAAYDFASDFGCSGINEYKSIVSQYIMPWLPRAITTPAGGVYNIYYDGNGRLGEITFPAGGSIAYGYSGGNNGINCNSGVVPTLTVTVNDNNGNNSVWTIVNNNNSSSTNNFTVTETDPASNQTVYNFGGEYQTQAKYYEGSATGTPLETVITCYNGNFTNCATWSLRLRFSRSPRRMCIPH